MLVRVLRRGWQKEAHLAVRQAERAHRLPTHPVLEEAGRQHLREPRVEGVAVHVRAPPLRALPHVLNEFARGCDENRVDLRVLGLALPLLSIKAAGEAWMSLWSCGERRSCRCGHVAAHIQLRRHREPHLQERVERSKRNSCDDSGGCVVLVQNFIPRVSRGTS